MGGTEVYVQALAREQQALGFEVEVAAPAKSNSTYRHGGLRVRRFATGSQVGLRDLYGEGDKTAAETFASFALEGKPDIVHLHAFTSAVSLLLVRALRRRGIPVIFTYHTPTVTCARGTLLHFGREVCGGEMSPVECCACTLQGQGLNGTLGRLLAHVPDVFVRIANKPQRALPSKVQTALQMRQLIQRRTAAALAFFEEVDEIVAVCQWIKDVLVRNRVPGAKITLSRQGLPHEVGPNLRPLEFGQQPLRLVFLGRLSATKGVEILAEAVTKVEADVQLDIYAVAQDAEGLAIRERLTALSENFPRVRIFTPVASREVVSTLRNYHVLAVPSQWLETGPLVVYEAFAAGLPVLGSNLGGIAELVSHEFNGILVNGNAVEDWVESIQSLAEKPSLVTRLAANVLAPRSMAEAAREMAELYLSVSKAAPSAV